MILIRRFILALFITVPATAADGVPPVSADSTGLFHEPGMWETHRVSFIFGFSFIVLQSLLIGSLLAARRRARETNASLNLAADAAQIGLWRRDPKSNKIVSNLRWRKIFGLPDDGNVTKDDVWACMSPEDRARMTESFRQSARDNEPFSLEHQVIHPDGTVRWLATHGRAEAIGSSGVYGTTGASVDITERRETEEKAHIQRQELAHLSRVSSLGVLSGSLAHELNQPLGIILSNAQAAEFLLESENPDLEELRAIISDIISEDRRAGEVIKRLRALLRRGETAPQPIDVNESVREVLRLTHSDLISRGVTAGMRLAPSLPSVSSDRVQIQQVLLNLVVNACDAMSGNARMDRTLVIETRETEDEIRISVSDRGVGLPEDVEALFEPFHSTKEHGLGMGLAICRTLITAHGGRLWAEPNPDCGSTFVVALPKDQNPP